MKYYSLPFILTLSTSLFLGACMSSGTRGEAVMTSNQPMDPAISAPSAEYIHPKADIRNYALYAPSQHHKSLNDYAEQMLMQLQTQASVSDPIAVTSFVEFDQSLRSTNSLGNQLAEAFLVEMSRSGYPVAEINATGAVQINEDGSFVFSRQQQGKFDDLCCVLSGNLIYESNGVRVNGKLFDLKSKRILSATSLTIPYFVVEHLGSVQMR